VDLVAILNIVATRNVPVRSAILMVVTSGWDVTPCRLVEVL
jgi:hypothetical protein